MRRAAIQLILVSILTLAALVNGDTNVAHIYWNDFCDSRSSSFLITLADGRFSIIVNPIWANWFSIKWNELHRGLEIVTFHAIGNIHIYAALVYAFYFTELCNFFYELLLNLVNLGKFPWEPGINAKPKYVTVRSCLTAMKLELELELNQRPNAMCLYLIGFDYFVSIGLY